MESKDDDDRGRGAEAKGESKGVYSDAKDSSSSLDGLLESVAKEADVSLFGGDSALMVFVSENAFQW